MDVSQTNDRNRLQAWLQALPKETKSERADARQSAVAVAHRAAMRALPGFWGWAVSRRATLQKRSAIPILRCGITSTVSTCFQSEKIMEAAKSANFFSADVAAAADPIAALSASSIRAAAHASSFDCIQINAVVNAATRASEATKFSDRLFKQNEHDRNMITAGLDLSSVRLWEDNEQFSSKWIELKTKILRQGDDWRFWVDWYESVLHGRQQDYDLLTKIVLISPSDWDKGENHINALIQKIIAAKQTTPSFPPTRIMTERVQSFVQANGPVLALQLGSLVAITDQEIERIRGTNNLEAETREGLLAALNKLKEAAKEILALLPESGAISALEVEQIVSWGGVLKEQAQHWNAEAKKFIAGKSVVDERVVFTGRLVLASAVAGPLSLMGLGTFAAVAGGAILLKDKLDLPKAISAIKSGASAQ